RPKPGPYWERHAMSIFAWIVLGLIAGWIGSKIVNKTGEGFFLDIVLGVVGALVGGFLFSLFGAEGVSGLNLYSLFVAIIGSIVGLVRCHPTLGRRAAASREIRDRYRHSTPRVSLPGGGGPNAGRGRRAIRWCPQEPRRGARRRGSRRGSRGG